MRTLLIIGFSAAALFGSAVPGAAQSVVARSPNLLGGWSAPTGVIQFNFLHRFAISDAPLRKITNTPTFNLGTGLTNGLMVGFVYGSNSTLVPAYPNEWEFYARAIPLSQARGAPFDLALHGGYNVASESIDLELLLARGFGDLKLLAAGRAFSEGYEGTGARYAVTGGASVRLTQAVSLAGDYGVLLDRTEDERAAWGVGVQIGVPYTPHSFSINASNVGTASLEGASRGGRTRLGFEYTVPITLRRYASRRGGSGPSGGAGRAFATGGIASGDTVVVDIQNIKYGVEEIVIAPGTTVVWRNRDPIQHSVVSDQEGFDSSLIDPETSFALTFSDIGEYPFHCMPHPFMKGRVVVQEGAGSPDGTGRGETHP